MQFISRHCCGVLVAVLACASAESSGQSPQASEYQVKAAFLYNFCQFVEWPSTSFEQNNSPLIVAVIGDDPFGPYLDEVFKKEVINGHPIEIRRFSTLDGSEKLHMAFLSPKDAKDLQRLTSILKGKGVLTVGDFNGFTRHGGMIRFLTEDNRIKLRINHEAAKTERLAISSKLLRLAEIVSSKN